MTVAASASNPNRDWTLRAACRDADPELFKPRSSRNAHQHPAVQQALRYCRQCPVITACDTEAAAAPYPMAGVWAGRYYSPIEAEHRYQQQKRATESDG